MKKAKLYNFYTDTPKGKFIALYDDGSGCELFCETSEGLFTEIWNDTELIVTDVDKDWFTDAGYLNFILLPDNFSANPSGGICSS